MLSCEMLSCEMLSCEKLSCEVLSCEVLSCEVSCSAYKSLCRATLVTFLIEILTMAPRIKSYPLIETAVLKVPDEDEERHRKFCAGMYHSAFSI